MIGTLNGLVFLPVLLSLAGPGPEVGIPQVIPWIRTRSYGRVIETDDFSSCPQMQILNVVILLVPFIP